MSHEWTGGAQAPFPAGYDPASKGRLVSPRSHSAVTPQTFTHHLRHARRSRLRASAGNAADKRACAHGTSGLPWAERQVKAGSANAARGLTWASANGLKAGWGEGEAGRCQEKSALGEEEQKFRGRKGPTSESVAQQEATVLWTKWAGEREAKRGSLTPQGIIWDSRQAHFWGTYFQDNTRGGSVKSKKEGSGKTDYRSNCGRNLEMSGLGRGGIYRMLQILEELSREVVPFQGYLPWWLRGKEFLRRLQIRVWSLAQEDLLE